MSALEKYNETFIELATYMQALAHPARLQIVEHLSKYHECPAGAISSELPLSKSTVSQHMAKLREAGLISCSPDGVIQNYRLNMETLNKIAGEVNEDTFVVSLAPKITIEKIASKVKTANIVRMIPNATSYINEGYNPLAFHPAMLKKEKKQIKKLFKPLGKTFETEEHKLEGYALISGMLPTYFWFQWQELEAIGEKTGLSKEEAAKTIQNTLKNAIKLWYKSGLTPEEVMDLIPVKPIGENEEEIKNTLNAKLLGLFEKIKP